MEEIFTIDTSTLLQLGAGAVVAYAIVRLVFDFLKPVLERVLGVKAGPQPCTKCDAVAEQVAMARKEMAMVKDQIKDLYVWHNVRNQDGVPVWYVPSSLEKAIQMLADNVAAQTDVLRGVAQLQKDTAKCMERLERRMDKEA